MLNQTVLVGRLARDIEVKELEDGKSVAIATLAVSRSYKNKDGVYDTDFIDCELWNSVAINTSEYCRKGDMVGIKGSVKTEEYEVDGEKKKKTSILADKVTFLSTKSHEKDESEINAIDKDTEDNLEV